MRAHVTNSQDQQRCIAEHVGVHVRTIRNWISEGLITGYKLPGARAIRVDLDEIDQKMKVMPTVIRARPQPFGPKATIVQYVDAYEPPAPGQEDHRGQGQDQTVKASSPGRTEAERWSPDPTTSPRFSEIVRLATRVRVRFRWFSHPRPGSGSSASALLMIFPAAFQS